MEGDLPAVEDEADEAITAAAVEEVADEAITGAAEAALAEDEAALKPPAPPKPCPT